MDGHIETQFIDIDSLLRESSDYAAVELLPGEVEGAAIRVVRLKPKATLRVEHSSTAGRIHFFMSGSGTAETSQKRFAADENAVFYPASEAYAITCTDDMALCFLEIELAYSCNDREELATYQDRAPLFCVYSKCPTYREKIKSPKTVSRTLIPTRTVPRFCMGSVQSAGPDEVKPHRHPMVDQLFIGLSENACTVIADGKEMAFRENSILHIPLGASHGIKVDEGQTLDYLWLDFFKDSSQMSYIEREHIPDRE